MSRPSLFLTFASIALLVACVSLDKPRVLMECENVGCKNEGSMGGKTTRTGGSSSTGGMSATGGGISTGGMSATGGGISSGGVSATGGGISSGGVNSGGTSMGGTSMGGVFATGGAGGSGGAMTLDAGLTSSDLQNATEVGMQPETSGVLEGGLSAGDCKPEVPADRPTDGPATGGVVKLDAGGGTGGKTGTGGSGGSAGTGGTGGTVTRPRSLTDSDLPNPKCTNSQIEWASCSDSIKCSVLCGADNHGTLTRTCTDNQFIEGECIFSSSKNYACYSIKGIKPCATRPPTAGEACDVSECKACGSETSAGFIENPGDVSRVGYCVCSNKKWSCGVNASWPCGEARTGC